MNFMCGTPKLHGALILISRFGKIRFTCLSVDLWSDNGHSTLFSLIVKNFSIFTWWKTLPKFLNQIGSYFIAVQLLINNHNKTYEINFRSSFLKLFFYWKIYLSKQLYTDKFQKNCIYISRNIKLKILEENFDALSTFFFNWLFFKVWKCLFVSLKFSTKIRGLIFKKSIIFYCRH